MDYKIGDKIKYIKNGKSGEGLIYEYFGTGELRVNGLLVNCLDEYKIIN